VYGFHIQQAAPTYRLIRKKTCCICSFRATLKSVARLISMALSSCKNERMEWGYHTY